MSRLINAEVSFQFDCRFPFSLLMSEAAAGDAVNVVRFEFRRFVEPRNLLSGGVVVFLNKVPVTDSGWTNAPYEAQYLKLYDVTPTTVTIAATMPNAGEAVPVCVPSVRKPTTRSLKKAA